MPNHEASFLVSALTLDNPSMPSDAFLDWIREKNSVVKVEINQIPFAEMRRWVVDRERGMLRHETGRFFSIEGIRITTDWGLVPQWDQPIINQPEVGFLGIITKKIDGVLRFLMQAKIEPGNLNVVQLSPTLQATRSNYTQVHGGRKPLYLEYFNGEKPVEIILDQLQSEQGARFLRKRNRNVIVLIGDDEEIPVYDNFCWLTLGQIKGFLTHDNLVNMDTRTVISGISFGEYPNEVMDLLDVILSRATSAVPARMGLLLSSLDRDHHLHSLDELISWITRMKASYELDVERIPLQEVRHWVFGTDEIYHEKRKYFSVIGVNVLIDNREVASWDQPLVKSAQEGIMAFIVKKINGVYHFLVQAKLEAGNFDIIELAPTVQCLTGNYREGLKEYDVPFLDVVLEARADQIWSSAFQSEEGGRFFHEQNRNMIVEVGDEFPVEVPETYIWMTLHQMKTFIKYNNYLNIAARSLIAAIRFV